MRYVVYDLASGLVERNGQCSEESLAAIHTKVSEDGHAAEECSDEAVIGGDRWTRAEDGTYFQADPPLLPPPTEAEVLEQKRRDVVAARLSAYGSIGDQLDMIFHEGIDAWREHIAAVKAQFPKPPNLGG